MWVRRSGRVLKKEELLLSVDTILLPVTRGGIREIVSLSQAQGCTEECDDDFVAAVIGYQDRWRVTQQKWS